MNELDAYLDSLLSLPRPAGERVSPDGRWIAWSWFGLSEGADVLRRFARIVASDETKAQETAILGAALGIAPETAPDLHENDRSATGFLPPPEFERMADAFFAAPTQSVRGWEPAHAAQLRIVRAVDTVLAAAPDAATLFVGHGGVGTLLKCHCGGRPIARSEDQGGGGGGNHFAFRWGPPELLHDWRPMELPPP